VGTNKMQHNTTHSKGLSAEQLSAIAALRARLSVTDAAKQIGVDRSTIYRWLHGDEVFVSELNQAKQEQLDAVRAELSLLACEATRTLREILLSADAPGPVKLKTAIAVLHALGALVPEKIGSTDPQQIRSEQITRQMISAI
jgi:transposase